MSNLTKDWISIPIAGTGAIRVKVSSIPEDVRGDFLRQVESTHQEEVSAGLQSHPSRELGN